MLLRRRSDRRERPARRAALTARPRLLSGEDLLPPPAQRRTAEKRARLKAAALRLFGERGYEGTGIEAIAQQAGVAVGGFYQHFRSKRQLLVSLMDELLEALASLELTPSVSMSVRDGLRALLARAFAHDLQYLGAYRAWQEALLSDPDLARKQAQIHAWTTARVEAVLRRLQQSPGTRKAVDVAGLARVIDSFFWSLLAQATTMSKADLNRSLDAATHIIFHAMFTDEVQRPPAKRRRRRRPQGAT